MATHRKRVSVVRSKAGTTRAKDLKAANARLRIWQQRVAALKVEVRRLEQAHAADQRSSRQRMTQARRRFEARLTRMVQEIGELRHHETRSRSLERALVTKDQEIRRLSALRHG